MSVDATDTGSRRHNNGPASPTELSSSELITRYAAMIDQFGVYSIEEAGWIEMTEALGDRVQLVGETSSSPTPAPSQPRRPAASPTPH
ncbi:hypothetical protein [Catenulispora acidiphila]|uniref:hypothetical protein n=1 Tax=Catenulispora acidiphila TaxID=304895 RepID=UPI0006760EBF|nr:hypothetical protein [Catenulispora acidiphila]